MELLAFTGNRLPGCRHSPWGVLASVSSCVHGCHDRHTSCYCLDLYQYEKRLSLSGPSY
jgi:hypothetical protein